MSEKIPAVQHRHFATLDGLRGVAAYAVLVVHLSIAFDIHIFPHGYLAVDFFFVLSGFVVARAYEQRLKGNLSFWQFFRIRLIRLYPLVLAGALAGAAVIFTKAFLEGNITLASIDVALLCALLFIPLKEDYVYDSNDAFPLNMPQWSLLYELLINFFYAITVRRLTPLALSIIILLSAAALIASGSFYGDLDKGFQLHQAGAAVLRVMFSFSAGVWLFRQSSKDTGIWRVRAPGCMLAAVLAASFAVPEFSMEWIYDCACVITLYPLLVALGKNATLSPRTTRIGLFLGEISYPIYILHYPMAAIFTHFCAIVLHLPLLYTAP